MPLGRIRTSVSLRYGFEKYANALRDCSWSRRPRYPQSRRPAPPDARSRRFRQEDFHAQDALHCALDFPVEAGQDRNSTPVIPVLIRIPGIPAAAQRICVRVSRAQVRLWRHGGLRGRDAGRCEACEDDRRESSNHPWPRAPANAGTKMPHVRKMRRVIIPASLGISLRKTDC